LLAAEGAQVDRVAAHLLTCPGVGCQGASGVGGCVLGGVARRHGCLWSPGLDVVVRVRVVGLCVRGRPGLLRHSARVGSGPAT
jgi:hypothetical protein